MKEWWNHLALREKQLLSLGFLFICIFLLYLLVLNPLDQKVTDIRNQISRNQELLAWMQDADKKIQSVEKSSLQNKNIGHSSGSLLSIIQKQINRTPLVSTLSQLHQVENDSVQLTFQKVDFDQLLKWLIQVSKQEGIQISQAHMTPSPSPGIVSAEIVVK